MDINDWSISPMINPNEEKERTYHMLPMSKLSDEELAALKESLSIPSSGTLTDDDLESIKNLDLSSLFKKKEDKE